MAWGVEAVKKPLETRLGAPVPIVMRQQREQSMTRVAGVFDNYQGLPLTPPGIEVLDGRKLCPSNVLSRTHYPLQCLAVGGRAVAIPGSDATSQDALDGAAVKPFEDPRTHAKSFQSPEGE